MNGIPHVSMLYTVLGPLHGGTSYWVVHHLMSALHLYLTECILLEVTTPSANSLYKIMVRSSCTWY